MAFRASGTRLAQPDGCAVRRPTTFRQKATDSMSAATAIPRYPSDVTGTWLAGVLSAAGAPVEVESVEVTPVGTGQTGATFRVAATYASNPDNLPESFILKLPAGDDAVRDRVTL